VAIVSELPPWSNIWSIIVHIFISTPFLHIIKSIVKGLDTIL
jgi:hypothetical protein